MNVFIQWAKIILLVAIFIISLCLLFHPKAFVSVPSNIKPTVTISQQIVQHTNYSISKGSVPSIPFQLPSGFVIHIFASKLGSPRALLFTPDGILLVSDPSNNRVFALSDVNRDGAADSKKVIITGENHVHGLAMYQNQLFIADVDKVVRYTWDKNILDAARDRTLFPLPENQDHNNRSLLIAPDGKLYITLGSTCNVCREDPTIGGSILQSDINGAQPRIFASGLRNSPFLAFNPTTHDIWGTEMGRDYLGDNTPPDEINVIHDGQNYGWPNCYGNKIHDTSFDRRPTDPCVSTIPPMYEIPAHSAPLGLVFINSSQFPMDQQGDLLVAYHGSWNRSTPTGYKIVHLKVKGNNIVSSDNFLTGFLPDGAVNGPNDALGRPVDMVFDTKGNLYVSDDKAGNVYIIQKK